MLVVGGRGRWDFLEMGDDSRVELESQLDSYFLFLKDWMDAALADFHCSRWRLDSIMIKFGKQILSFVYR